MLFEVDIHVMPLRELLDPQGKTVEESLHSLGFSGIEQLRIGRRITSTIEATDKAEAELQIQNACKELLYNPVMEYYEYSLSPKGK